VRRQAADALRQIGSPAVAPLIAVLGDRSHDWEVLLSAAGVLGQIGDARAAEPLIGALKAALDARAPDVMMRLTAAEALGQIGDPCAVEVLAAAFKEEPATRSVAAQALVKIGAPAVATLKAALQGQDTKVCAPPQRRPARSVTGRPSSPLPPPWETPP